MELRTVVWGLTLGLLAISCARYGIRHDDSRQYPEAQLVLPISKSALEENLKKFFDRRGLTPSLHRSLSGASSDLEGEWVRDSSLELFYIASGSRKPHLVHWKAVWRLESLGPRSTQIQIELMELMFMGPQENASALPTLDGQWVEAPKTNLRAWLEMRRFFTESYPRENLPRELTILKIPTLDFAPLSLKDTRPERLYKNPRPASF